MIAPPLKPPSPIVTFDDRQPLRRVRFRLWQITWAAAVVLVTGWFYSLGLFAGITATAGGLVFTGDLDGRVLAFDAITGKVLWSHTAGGAIGGGVVAFEAGNKERVAVAVGLNSPIWPVKGGPARVLIYALP